MITLSDGMRYGFDALGLIRFGLATGGSQTTAVVGALAEEGLDDDYNGGTLFVTRDSAGASAAPEGEFQAITDFTDFTGTFEFATLTEALAAGDTVAWTDDEIGTQQMLSLVNDALELLGDIPNVDTTTLDTEGSKTEYTSSWNRERPYRIDFQTNTGDADDNRWQEISDWDYIPAAPGEDGLIVFDFQPLASRDIRVHYMAAHGKLNAYGDRVYEGVTPKLMRAAVSVVGWRYLQTVRRGTDDYTIDQLNAAEVEFDRKKMESPIYIPAKGIRLRLGGIFDITPSGRLPYPADG